MLRPFLLRRLKKDVNIGITEKRELVVYADMSEIQVGGRWCLGVSCSTSF